MLFQQTWIWIIRVIFIVKPSSCIYHMANRKKKFTVYLLLCFLIELNHFQYYFQGSYRIEIHCLFINIFTCSN